MEWIRVVIGLACLYLKLVFFSWHQITTFGGLLYFSFFVNTNVILFIEVKYTNEKHTYSIMYLIFFFGLSTPTNQLPHGDPKHHLASMKSSHVTPPKLWPLKGECPLSWLLPWRSFAPFTTVYTWTRIVFWFWLLLLDVVVGLWESFIILHITEVVHSRLGVYNHYPSFCCWDIDLFPFVSFNRQSNGSPKMSKS